MEDGIENADERLDVVEAKVPSALVTAKGDLVVGTGSGAVTRLPAGTNGQVLKANSAATMGVEWTADDNITDHGALGGLADDDHTQYHTDTRGDVRYYTKAGADARYQPLDADLTQVAGLTPSADDLIQRKSGVWTNRTPAQVKTDLAVTKSDVGLGNVDNTSDINKPVSTAQANADSTRIALSTIDAKGDLIAGTADNTIARLPVGTTGQVLKANSGTTTGLEWAADIGIPATVVDAKGDIVAATAPDVVTRLGVGTDGQVLTASAAAATGLAWTTPTSGAGGYATVLDEGTARTQRTSINFVGAGVSATDDSANGRTVVTISGAGGATSIPRLGPIRVASNECSTDLKGQCDYVCTGTNDQTVINQALVAAARPSDIAGGLGAGAVELVGPNFYIGNNNTGVILMPPAVWLRGAGPGTLVQPMFSSFTGLGCIQLLATDVDHTRISDLSIGRPESVASRCHGIMYSMSAGSGDAYQINTGNDPYHRVSDIFVLDVDGSGLYFTGSSGGCRETHIDHVQVWNSDQAGFRWEGSSDSKFTSCTASPGSAAGYIVGGGNTKMVNCKAYFADGATTGDGYSITSGRCELIACAAQDNGRYGFNVTGGDVTMSGCVADSNSRQSTTGGGFLIGATGTYSGLSCFDRNQTPASPQLRGFIFSGTPQVYLTGRASAPSGTAHVVGAPGTNSYMRVVRDGTTLATAG